MAAKPPPTRQQILASIIGPPEKTGGPPGTTKTLGAILAKHPTWQPLVGGTIIPAATQYGVNPATLLTWLVTLYGAPDRMPGDPVTSIGVVARQAAGPGDSDTKFVAANPTWSGAPPSAVLKQAGVPDAILPATKPAETPLQKAQRLEAERKAREQVVPPGVAAERKAAQEALDKQKREALAASTINPWVTLDSKGQIKYVASVEPPADVLTTYAGVGRMTQYGLAEAAPAGLPMQKDFFLTAWANNINPFYQYIRGNDASPAEAADIISSGKMSSYTLKQHILKDMTVDQFKTSPLWKNIGPGYQAEWQDKWGQGSKINWALAKTAAENDLSAADFGFQITQQPGIEKSPWFQRQLPAYVEAFKNLTGRWPDPEKMQEFASDIRKGVAPFTAVEPEMRAQLGRNRQAQVEALAAGYSSMFPDAREPNKAVEAYLAGKVDPAQSADTLVTELKNEMRRGEGPAGAIYQKLVVEPGRRSDFNSLVNTVQNALGRPAPKELLPYLRQQAAAKKTALDIQTEIDSGQGPLGALREQTRGFRAQVDALTASMYNIVKRPLTKEEQTDMVTRARRGQTPTQLEIELKGSKGYTATGEYKGLAERYVNDYYKTYGQTPAGPEMETIRSFVLGNKSLAEYEQHLRAQPGYVKSPEYQNTAASLTPTYQDIYGRLDDKGQQILHNAVMGQWTPDRFAQWLRSQKEYTKSPEYKSRMLNLLDALGLVTGQTAVLAAPHVPAVPAGVGGPLDRPPLTSQNVPFGDLTPVLR